MQRPSQCQMHAFWQQRVDKEKYNVAKNVVQNKNGGPSRTESKDSLGVPGNMEGKAPPPLRRIPQHSLIKERAKQEQREEQWYSDKICNKGNPGPIGLKTRNQNGQPAGVSKGYLPNEARNSTITGKLSGNINGANAVPPAVSRSNAGGGRSASSNPGVVKVPEVNAEMQAEHDRMLRQIAGYDKSSRGGSRAGSRTGSVKSYHSQRSGRNLGAAGSSLNTSQKRWQGSVNPESECSRLAGSAGEMAFHEDIRSVVEQEVSKLLAPLEQQLKDERLRRERAENLLKGVEKNKGMLENGPEILKKLPPQK